jgi:hypothetical protein
MTGLASGSMLGSVRPLRQRDEAALAGKDVECEVWRSRRILGGCGQLKVSMAFERLCFSVCPTVLCGRR